MKLKLFSTIFQLAFVLLLPQFASAQPKPATVKKPDPKIATSENTVVTIDLNALDAKLSKLDLLIKDVEGKLAPHISVIGEELNNAFSHLDLDGHVVIVDGSKHGQGDPVTSNYVQAAEKIKKINKSYSVDANDKLSVNNQYGSVTINVWDKKEIKVDVEIKAFESSESKAQELLDNVEIGESRQGNVISFKTSFNKSNMSWWSRTKNGKEEKRGVQVNYTVYMPSKNPLDVTNRYGSTKLPEFNGPVNINSSYGSLTAEKLSNPANRVKVSYGSATLENFSSGMLDLSYGSLKLANADKLNANIRYSTSKIERLTNSGKIDLAYGSCRIEKLDKNIQNLNINSSYSGLTLGIDDSANFNFDVTVSYAGFNFNDDRVNITQKTPDENARGFNPTKHYIGTYGKGSDARVIIKSNYGGVKFL